MAVGLVKTRGCYGWVTFLFNSFIFYFILFLKKNY